MRRTEVLSRAPRRSLLADRMTPILCRHHRDLKDACSAPTARRSAPRRPTPPRLQSVDRLDRARCFSLNDVHSRREHERAQGRRPANIKAMAATGRNGVSNADERTRRARSARPSADKCSTFRINGRSADELRLAQVRMPTGAGAKMILQVHLPRDGPAHGRVGHPYLGASVRPRVCGG